MIQPLTISTLQPIPLPKTLQFLPQQILDEFVSQHELVSGYIRSLTPYERHHKQVVDELNYQIDKLNEIKQLLANYNDVSTDIDQQTVKIRSLFEEFVNLETYQYQLLSSNFNRDFIKNKFAKMTQQQQQSDAVDRLIAGYKKNGTDENEDNDDDNNTSDNRKVGLDDLVKQFRQNRKQYHLRREKLNRWNEERVSGFI